MKYFGLTGLRALYQTVCFGFIGAVALGSHIFGYPTSEIRDTGGINKTVITSVKDAVASSDTPEIAKSFKTVSNINYSTPVNTVSASGNKTLYFSQPIVDTPTRAASGKSCTEYDAGSRIMRCADYGGKFYYAHRAGAFAQLPGAEVNDYIVIGGQTYKVMEAYPYSKTSINMDEVVNAKNIYSISLMTCYGSNDSQRYIVYANRV